MRLPARYRQLASPAFGGFGNTIICLDKNLDRKVIIKQINNPLDIDRLFVEIEALQKAKSKHVVEIYDAIVSDGGNELAIVEEFLPKDDLTGFRANVNNIDELINILYHLSCGLADIHECGIVHRDFKPNNVKFDSENIIKIFDFGLAKHASLPTSTTGIIGTTGYMAPELFMDPPIIDKPVDCYAFGATAFEFVTGSTPACARNRPTPRSLRQDEGISNYIDLGARVTPLIDSCLALDANDRPLLKDIKNVLEKKLLYGKHKSTIVYEGKTKFLEQVGQGVKISRGIADYLTISYNGYDFIIKEVSGDVYVNGVAVKKDHVLEGSSVIILGKSSLGGYRKFVSFDISHPEVVL